MVSNRYPYFWLIMLCAAVVMGGEFVLNHKTKKKFAPLKPQWPIIFDGIASL